MAALEARKHQPEKLFPIIVDNKSAISTREQLQQLVGGQELPAVREARLTTFTGDKDLGAIQVCEVTLAQLGKIQRGAKYNLKTFVRIEQKLTGTIFVERVKDVARQESDGTRCSK